ncbi:MAG: fused MFS/spermidine synthase [Acidimicrobiia bacterium]|nr:fused MFS/spermidine synthase [Acidimicrobiia bacterium]
MSIVLLAGSAFFLPAAVLSAVSPMVAKLRLLSLEETGSVVGGLSAAGTAGALVGTFITGFVLIATLPSRPILLVVGAVLVLAGLAARWWLERRPPAASMALVLLAGGLAVFSGPPCEYETAYFCVQVEIDGDRDSGRVLRLDQLRHAYVDLDDPTYLDFRYVRLLADVSAALPPGPLDVLHVGGGGFTFPRYLAAVRPGTESLVLEIDPALVEIAEDELALERGPDLRVETGDARLRLDDQPTDAYDLVVGDAFGSETVPWHLTTVEVAEQLERMLRPGGIYTMNVIDGGPSDFARAELATLGEVFDHVAVIHPPGGIPEDRAVNQILVASASPLPELDVDPADGVVVEGDALEAFVGDAGPLTDEYAPVDNLVLH